MKKSSGLNKGVGTLFPVANWNELMQVHPLENPDDDDVKISLKFERPNDLKDHLTRIGEKCNAIFEIEFLRSGFVDGDVRTTRALEAFYGSLIANWISDAVESGDYDIRDVISLSIRLGQLSTVAEFRPAERDYASGRNMKASSKKATQAVTKLRPTKTELKRTLASLRKLHSKETRVIVEAAKHYKVGKSTLYKWKSQLGI